MTVLAYGESFDILRIGTDVYPANDKTKNISPNSTVSMRAAIAHEIVGHREAAFKGEICGDELLEEVQASIRAARFSPFLNKTDRLTLLRDALYRLRQNDRKLKNVRAFLHINER